MNPKVPVLRQCHAVVACRRIENWNEARWSTDELPHGVAQWNKDRIISLQGEKAPELEGFIAILSSSLRNQSSPPARMCNLLAFLETLAAHECPAQVLVNSSLTQSLIDLFEHEDAMVRTRSATVLGVLIRFATTINVNMLRPGGESSTVSTECRHALP